MNRIAKKKRPEGADIASGMALMVTGVATRAAPLVLLGVLLIGKGVAALKKRAAGGDQKPLPKGFVPVTPGKTPVLSTALKQKRRKDETIPQHAHLTDVSGQFDPVTGYYSLPEVVPCICPKCGTVTDTSRRFCYKCDTDLKKAHGG
ncbi:hypothetical protein SDC9_54690 [bioreactor metagenome]|uniref:Uncharacterized protein n=1 Tax=bioreactor metagenome TaxID=1076179 RepID=A0A644WY21_9ZZZZ